MNQVEERLTTRLIVIIVVASLAVVPMAIYGLGPEWARWDAAQANAFFRQGKVKDALYQLRDAVRKSPRDPVLKLTLAEQLIEIDQAEEGLQLANEVLDAYPGNANATQMKSYAQHQIGAFSDALETRLEYDRDLEAYRRDNRNLNELAYYRALAKRELPQANRDIERVVKQVNRYVSWSGDQDLQPAEKTVVLAALVAMQCDHQLEAIVAISNQLKPLNERLEIRNGALSQIIYNEMQTSFPVRQSAKVAKIRERVRDLEGRAAVLLTCRALLSQSVGNTTGCRVDRIKVRELGFNSDQIASKFPEDKLALQMLGQITSYLDTRGFVRSLLPWDDRTVPADDPSAYSTSSFPAAIRDLEAAVFGSEIELASLDSDIRNSLEFFEDKVRTRKRLKRQTAVLVYHLHLVLKRAGDDRAARATEEKIRNLGFDPGPKLF